MAKSRSVSPVQETGLSHITWPSVKLAKFGRVDPASGSADFHCSLPKGFEKLFDIMGWDVPGDKTMSEKLEGTLKGGHLVLTAQDKLVNAEVDIEYVSISGFQCLRLEIEGRKGKGFRRELRFSATFKQQDACALLEAYQFASNNAKGTLRVTYVVEPVQANLVPDGVTAPTEAPMFDDIRDRIANDPKTN